MLRKDHNEERSGKVSQKTEEVLQITGNVLSSNQAEENDGNEAKHGPDESGNNSHGASNLLKRETSTVHSNAVHANTGEHKHEEDKLGKAVRVNHGLDEETNALVVLPSPHIVVVEAGTNNSSKHHTNAGRDGDTHGGENEDLQLGGVSRILDVVIRCYSRPRRRAAVDDTEQSQSTSRQIRALQSSRDGQITKAGHLAVHDHEDDEEGDPCKLLIGEDGLQSHKRANKTNHRDENHTQFTADLVVRESLKRQSTSNATNRRPTNLLDSIEDSDQLRRPPA